MEEDFILIKHHHRYHEGKWQERTTIATVKKQRGNKTLQHDWDVEDIFKHDPGNALQWRLGEKCSQNTNNLISSAQLATFAPYSFDLNSEIWR